MTLEKKVQAREDDRRDIIGPNCGFMLDLRVLTHGRSKIM
jgi:hypothetical protein